MIAGMTKRERMRAAFAHRETDRVPRGELCIESDIANRLLGTNFPADYQHFERDLAVRMLLGIDFINLGDWPAEKLGIDEKGYQRWRSVYGEEYATKGRAKRLIRPPLEDIADAAAYRVPDIGRVSGGLVRRFAEETDLFVMGQIGGPVSMLDEMFGMEDYLVYCLTNPAEIRNIGEKVMEFEVAKAKLFIDAGAEAILIADDIAFNSGCLLPPYAMQELVYPLYRIALGEIKRHKDVPVVFHSDGDLRLCMDELADCGFDGLHSIQPSAGMDIAEVKRGYGDRLCLFGNIDLDWVMTMASPEEVERVTRRTIETAAPGGGYVLATCNTLIDAIPEANALAMYRCMDGKR
jgi:uroporphyrinogen decarboxylase